MPRPRKAEFLRICGRHTEFACYFLNGIGGKRVTRRLPSPAFLSDNVHYRLTSVSDQNRAVGAVGYGLVWINAHQLVNRSHEVGW